MSTLVALLACGGHAERSVASPGGGGSFAGPGGGGAGGGGGGGGGGTAAPAPGRKVSGDAKDDYASALAFFQKSADAGWTPSSCRAAADQFSAVAREHKDLVEAQYMVGRSYHACGMAKEAQSAYEAALKINPKHGPSLSNIGELQYEAGKISQAKTSWENAIKANPKLAAAYVNLAMLQLDDLRKTTDQAAWTKLDEDTRKKLSISLAIDNENVRAYTMYGLVFMEGWEKNKNRLDMAKLLLEEGEKRDPKYAPLQHALGLLALHKNNLTEALTRFQAAEQLDGNLVEARMNIGLITLGFRRYDTAKDEFTKVLQEDPKDYDAMIGLGIAERGLGDLAGAEASYNKAQSIDGSRGEAYFNLGVLYKDFKASKESDLKASKDTYKKAKDYFSTFLGKSGSADDKEEAKQNIADCDKVMKQIDQFIQSMGSQPQGGTGGSGASAPAPATSAAPAPPPGAAPSAAPSNG
ncbi:MAG TPA: tetratricopeptide repeat protein [Kofleriaceae bacterium]|nr:tetratricopeptide repeat protein [Kofleriaceae bacterium]